ncbi:glycolipid transfer protein-like [Brachionichthys hirsutus]|uniref:glycolipid transfer protein-like n=1 Tax=Brachionichthys hirsutus TaxID=412623 RepID=UPI0036051312
MSLLLDNEFRELPADGSIDTKLFLEAVSHLPSFFDCMGSRIFSIIKSDISGNITKIKAVYLKDPVKYVTLRDIVVAERESNAAEWPKVGATLALMWLKRGLRFIQVLLQSLADGDRDENNPNHIRVNVVKAYEQALEKYHGWLVQNVFNAALLAAPYRSNFLKALSKGQEVKEEDCMEHVRRFLVNYTTTVDAIYELYADLNAELDYTA